MAHSALVAVLVRPGAGAAGTRLRARLLMLSRHAPTILEAPARLGAKRSNGADSPGVVSSATLVSSAGGGGGRQDSVAGLVRRPDRRLAGRARTAYPVAADRRRARRQPRRRCAGAAVLDVRGSGSAGGTEPGPGA